MAWKRSSYYLIHELRLTSEATKEQEDEEKDFYDSRAEGRRALLFNLSSTLVSCMTLGKSLNLSDSDS